MNADNLAQYTGVAVAGRVLLIGGTPGAGKSSLALALIDRGAALVGDDGVALSVNAGRLIAAPPQATKGLLEIRNVGIVTLECTQGPIALLLQITDDAPRYVEAALSKNIHGIEIPALPFTLGGICDALRAEYALKQHGLCF